MSAPGSPNYGQDAVQGAGMGGRRPSRLLVTPKNDRTTREIRLTARSKSGSRVSLDAAQTGDASRTNTRIGASPIRDFFIVTLLAVDHSRVEFSGSVRRQFERGPEWERRLLGDLVDI